MTSRRSPLPPSKTIHHPLSARGVTEDPKITLSLERDRDGMIHFRVDGRRSCCWRQEELSGENGGKTKS
jgi:hypothetical protein